MKFFAIAAAFLLIAVLASVQATPGNQQHGPSGGRGPSGPVGHGAHNAPVNHGPRAHGHSAPASHVHSAPASHGHGHH